MITILLHVYINGICLTSYAKIYDELLICLDNSFKTVITVV